MSRPAPLATTSVGVVVERRKAKSQWVDYVWRPIAALPGTPDTKPWTVLESDEEATQFYAGAAELGLYRVDTPHYRDNLASGAPALWIVLRPTASEPPYELVAVTADPSEGEGFTDAGNNLVEQVPMPPDIAEMVGQFVAQHHIDRPFVKRQRDGQTLPDRKERTSSD